MESRCFRSDFLPFCFTAFSNLTKVSLAILSITRCETQVYFKCILGHICNCMVPVVYTYASLCSLISYIFAVLSRVFASDYCSVRDDDEWSHNYGIHPSQDIWLTFPGFSQKIFAYHKNSRSILLFQTAVSKKFAIRDTFFSCFMIVTFSKICQILSGFLFPLNIRIVVLLRFSPNSKSNGIFNLFIQCHKESI